MIQSKLTLKQLETFVCVVDTGSFRKAAVVLGTTQPNVSARISALEKSLDTLLLHRDTGFDRLTEKGELLLESARQVLWAAESFLETASRQDLIEDRMRLGVTELVASTWLHEFLRQFRDEYPSIAVELEVNLSVEIEKGLSARQLDLAVLTGRYRSGAKGTTPLGVYNYAWVCTPTLARECGGDANLEKLLEVSVITHARHTAASLDLARFTKTLGLSPDSIVHSSSLSACVEMALDGMGVALLPEVVVHSALAEQRLVELEFDWKPDPLEFHARLDRSRAPHFVHAAADLASIVAAKHRESINYFYQT